MPEWLETTLGAVLGVGLIAGVFWFAFGRMPDLRSDGGLTQHDATNYSSGDDGGHSSF